MPENLDTKVFRGEDSAHGRANSVSVNFANGFKIKAMHKQ
jgi:hypothetical protein